MGGLDVVVDAAAAEAAGTADAAEARQLSPAEGEELEGLVNTVNNTFLLLLDHAQLVSSRI